jgi:hypothetical protein
MARLCMYPISGPSFCRQVHIRQRAYRWSVF